MIIGNGDIAQALKGNDLDRDDLIFFASGVSNSQCTDKEEFKREAEMLRQLGRAQDNAMRHIVYFSTLSIYEKISPYTIHKRDMESRIINWFRVSTIIRLGNITWGTNPNTIINYFKNNPDNISFRDEQKCICSLEEFIYWIKKIPKFTTEMNITGRRLSAREIFNEIKANRL